MTSREQTARRLARLAYWAAMVWLVAVVATLLLGCRRNKQEPTLPPTAIVDRRQCIGDIGEPPEPGGIDVMGVADGCPTPYLVCMTRESAIELVRYLTELQRWSSAAYIRCGPLPENPDGEEP
jgi:hypothetical protein